MGGAGWRDGGSATRKAKTLRYVGKIPLKGVHLTEACQGFGIYWLVQSRPKNARHRLIVWTSECEPT